MSRPTFNHIFVQDLQPGDIALIRIYVVAGNRPFATLVRVDSAYMLQGEWEVCGFDLHKERTVLAHYDHNELVPVQV
jgi:hypothetical protein